MTDIQYKRKFRILLAASQDARLSRGALAVLGYLLDHEDDASKLVERHHREISEAVGLTRPNVSRALGLLQEAGFVEVVAIGDRFKPGLYKARMPHFDGQGAQSSSEEHSAPPLSDMVEILSADAVDGIVQMTWGYADGSTEQVEVDLNSEQGHAELLEIISAARLGVVSNTDQLIGASFRIGERGDLLPNHQM
jgi:DNA-binding transcriptional ArsR family regulator